MTFEHYKKEFTREATKAGYSEENILRCLQYAEKLFANEVPVIYNTWHLARWVGYRKNFLKRATLFTPYFYRDFEVLKKNGKKRNISEPLPSLKEIQVWILNSILYKIEVSKFAKAYVPKSSIKKNLIFHKGQPQVLTIDIENFFPSIKLASVQEIFRSLGYSALISNLLAKLCCRDGSLPQGAPTSPHLSNLFLKTTDNIIFEFCKERNIKFTRYADDMTFSGSFNADELIAFVSSELGKLKLKVNDDKTKLMTPNMRQTVTGVVVNEKPQVSFYKRNKLRQEIYYIKKFGLQDHMQRKQIKKAHYIEHLLGKVNFILSINSDDTEFIGYKELLHELKAKSDQTEKGNDTPF
jgi:RNA-directed DNA polymerase